MAEYRKKLVSQGNISDKSSILIVVGREDTGELEAQVRGSRHAWDIRLISVDALLSLVKIKQDTDDPNTAGKIRTLLVPFDYTRLDEIIDIMFVTARDLETAVDQPRPEDAGATGILMDAPPLAADISAIGVKRDQLIRIIGSHFRLDFIKKTRATYWDAGRGNRLACSISKPYGGSIYRYWYAYHPAWDTFLSEGKAGYIAWGAADLDFSFVFSRNEFHPLLKHMITSTRPNGQVYWHVKIIEREGQYFLHLPLGGADLDLRSYRVG